RMISLGKREPGVYLIEVVNGDLRAYGIALVTNLVMVQKTSRDGQMLVYAADRTSGAPREGARLEIVKGSKTISNGATDRQGLYRTKMEQTRTADNQDTEDDRAAEGDSDSDDSASDAEPRSNSYLVMASAGEDFAISDLDSYYFGGGGEGASSFSARSYVYTDRPVYRPQQKVFFKGILRQITDSGYKLISGSTVSVTVEDPNGTRVFDQEVKLSSRGTFSGELETGEEAPLGSYSITARVGEATANGSFEVQEYKKPEFKTTVAASQQFVNVGEQAKFTVSARYFFGAPVARADVKYYVYRSRYYYPWWRSAGGVDEEVDFGIEEAGEEPEDDASGYGGYGDQMVQEGEGRLDANGRLEVEFKVPEVDGKLSSDFTYRLEAQVTDSSRRMMEGSASFVGVRSNTVAYANPERYVYYQGDTAKINVGASNREGRPVSTRVKLSFVERRWEKVSKRNVDGDDYPDYEMKEREFSSGVVETNAEGKASYDFVVPISGSIHIKTIIEEKGRQIVSQGGYIWVTDRNNAWSDLSYQEEGSIKLVPDKKSYRAGETAHVLALLPTDKAHLLVTTELMSVLTVRRVEPAGRGVMIDVPIEARYAPNVFLNVTYVKNGEMYTQDQMLVVPARDRLLKLDVIPNKKEYKPRETASYTILARSADGSPVAGAEVSLGVVDESIYSIAAENVADIRREFYGRRYSEVQTSYSTSYYFTGYAGKKPIKLARERRASQFADVKNDGELVNPRVRKLFKDTAFWQPDIVTGVDGKATINIELPDNLTTWRATARAITADTRVGTTVTKVVARKDLIMRVA
ncbi:MAG: MG2 domain-containing protein, partial [Acidobacteriota bacterium]|nr:MG2 domain-containing protein [Acidobacteriota bacterium]